MRQSTTTERVSQREYLHPLSAVTPALERMGFTANGEYCFAMSAVDPACDVLVLMRDDTDTALALYRTPVSAIDTETGRQMCIIRNQTILEYDGALTVVTSDVERCKSGGNHFVDAQFASADDTCDVNARGELEAFLQHVETLINCTRPQDLLDQTEFREHIKNMCAFGDNCLEHLV
ncbi:hypothetical protein KC973_03320 [Candidatus Saccharibacteria bacterium]|nr:hypothetical protein [Candidatus Saccharibacteria bacterium]